MTAQPEALAGVGGTQWDSIAKIEGREADAVTWASPTQHVYS